VVVVSFVFVIPIIVDVFESRRSGSVRTTHATTALLPAARAAEPNAERPLVPELDGGIAWLNAPGPIRLQDLRGKIVLLDFWTLCCINCIHTLPDLARLEKKYANELVVIGVHSAKFDNEKSTDSIRKAIARYEVRHPVVNDANMRIWRRYGVNSWPTLILVDPEGRLIGYTSGEGNYELLDRTIARVIEMHRAKKTLNDKPLRFDSAREDATSPLFFPGKVLADAASGRLFIADSTHHRIVITNLEGKKVAIAGTGGPGRADGPFATASFNDPQGMALVGDKLYVADRKNHLVRALDLKTATVETVAGNGGQGQDRHNGGKASEVGLNSPWDLLFHRGQLFIAMAGSHQIWVMDLSTRQVAPYAGDGRENIGDGHLSDAHFAQPSGLATDGKTLFVADSEISSVRAVDMDGKGNVRTLVGEGLFEFGDVDGQGNKVRLQHALGLVWVAGKLYVADTYNSKIKILDPTTGECTTYLGGEPTGWLSPPVFSEPAGISYANGKLYLADTNAHRIRVVDVKSKTVGTLSLQGVEAPKIGRQ
jgi:thiol-disulfide isomerase/thioredoxin